MQSNKQSVEENTENTENIENIENTENDESLLVSGLKRVMTSNLTNFALRMAFNYFNLAILAFAAVYI